MDRREEHKKQIDRFKEAARDLEYDEDEAVFEDRLRRLAKQKPKEKPAK